MARFEKSIITSFKLHIINMVMIKVEIDSNVFDFNLNNQQMKILDGLEEGLRFCPDPAEI